MENPFKRFLNKRAETPKNGSENDRSTGGLTPASEGVGNREAQIAQLQQQLQEVSAKHAQAERDLRDGNKAMADIFVPLYQKQIAELSAQIMARGGSLTAPVEKAVEVAAPQPPVESAPKQPKLSASELARQQFALHEAEGRAQREALLQKMKQRGAQ